MKLIKNTYRNPAKKDCKVNCFELYRAKTGEVSKISLTGRKDETSKQFMSENKQ